MIRRQRLCPGAYRYHTPFGGFGLEHRSDGWHLMRWAQTTGTVTYGVFERLAEADIAVTALCKAKARAN